MEDQKVKELAKTLRKSGLAVSEYEAIEKAKSILNVKCQKTDVSREEGQIQQDQEIGSQKESPNLDADLNNENVTVNDLMKEVNVSPEEVETQEQERLDNAQEKIDVLAEDIKETKENPENLGQIKEEIVEVKAEDNPQESNISPEQNDKFKEEEKIDLSKIFSYKK